MLEISKKSNLPDIVFEPEDVQVAALGTMLVLPPISRISMGKPISFTGRNVPAAPASFGELSKKIFEPEIKALLKFKDRYRNSYTYLARLASAYEASGDHNRAIEYAIQAKVLEDTPVMGQRLAELYLSNDQIAAALQIFNELRAKGYVDAHLRLAENAINNQLFDDAARIIEEAIAIDGDDWKLRLLAGMLAMSQRNYEQAIRHYRIAIQNKPQSSLLRLNVAVSHFLLGYTKKAISEVKKAVTLNPFNLNALYLYADLTLQNMVNDKYIKLDSLQKQLELYLSLMPNPKGLVGRLADVYFINGKINEGIALLGENAEKINDPIVWNNLGVFWATKNRDVAVSYYQKAIERNGGIKNAPMNRGSSFALLNFVNLLMDIKKYSQAEMILHEFISHADSVNYLEDESLCKIPVALIRSFVNQDKVPEAVKLAERLLTNPDMHVAGKLDLLTTLTTYHSLVSLNIDENLKYARQAVDLANQHKKELPAESLNLALNNLACAYIDSGNLEDARVLVDQLKIDINYAEYAYATKGLFTLQYGHIDRAKDLYQKAISLVVEEDRKNALRLKMNFEVGKYCFMHSDYKRAYQYLNKVVHTKNARDGWNFETLRGQATNFIRDMQQRRLLN